MKFLTHRKVLISMVFAGLTMLGYISYKQLPVELYPNAEFPFLVVDVRTSLQINPRYFESQAIIPLEGAIGTLAGIEEMTSNVGRSQSNIIVQFNKGTDMKLTYLKLIEKVNEAQQRIPEDFKARVVKIDLKSANNNLMTINARGSGGTDRIRNIAEEKLADPLRNIEGVANLQIFGGQKKSIEIILDDEVCKSYNITTNDVRQALQRNRMNKTFVGKVTESGQMHFVNIRAEYTELESIKDLLVKPKEGVRLRDIGVVRFGEKEQESYSRINGKESVTIKLSRDTQANLIDLSHAVLKKVNVLNKQLKKDGIELVVQQNEAEVIEKNINKIVQLALIGAFLAIFILWLFLGNLRLVFSIALAMPICVFVSFNFFYAAGITINTLTLLGVALAIGMLLDNSIVVLENIYRHVAKGKSIDLSVLIGTKEVWRSVFAATLTTIMVFLPFTFSSNFFIRLLGKNIGVSIVSTLLVSMLVALILIPMLTHTLFKHRKQKKSYSFEEIPFNNRLMQIYRVFLKTCIRYPVHTLLITLGVFLGTWLLSLVLSASQMQEAEVKDITLYVYMPSGSTLQKTDVLVKVIEEKLLKIEEAEEIVSQIYEEEALINIKLIKDFQKKRNLSVSKIKSDIWVRLREYNKFSRITFEPLASGNRFSSGPGGGGGRSGGMQFMQLLGIGSKSEHIAIRGEDFSLMREVGEKLRYNIDKLEATKRANVSSTPSRPELSLLFNKQLMELFDIPVQSVMSEIQSFPREVSGNSVYKYAEEEYDIQIRMLNAENTELVQKRNVEELKELPIRSNSGKTLPLKQLSRFKYGFGTSKISRKNQEKHLSVFYHYKDEITKDKTLLKDARNEVKILIEQMNIPSGVSVEMVEEENTLKEFGFLITLAIALIFMILASVFESFAKPLVILFSIPLASIGSLIALILTGNSLQNANVLMGLLILIGIVVNNGIILIDYFSILSKRGYNKYRALLTAGMTRVRPILITAITTIIALIPMALGKAEYVSAIGVPFALTIIGGLLFSTILTLIFIPTINTGVFRSLAWIRKQPLVYKLIIWIGWALGTWLVISSFDRKIIQVTAVILIIIGVPGIVYFLQSNLRKASELIIDPTVSLKIEIRNLVKIYDRESRFKREWKSGIKRINRKSKKRRSLIWKLPLLVFACYLVYFHILSGFWRFVLPVVIYGILLNLIKTIEFGTEQNKTRKFVSGSIKIIYRIVYWGFPALSMYLFHRIYAYTGLEITFALLWYLMLFIKQTSDKIQGQNININRITGRFKRVRKWFSRFVLAIPVVGKKKKPFKALQGTSLTIEHGMFGLLGPNGAGKSTLMRIISGILNQSYGSITINGIDLAAKREELQGLIGYFPQEFGMYENMSIFEFLNYMGIMKKLYQQKERHARIEKVLNEVHMFEHKDVKIGELSGGMKQRIGIAQILLNLPRILLVDEPTAGLDPRERIRFRNLLVELSKERIVIFSTHIIEDIASSCSKLAVINNGRLVFVGKPIDFADTAVGKVWMVKLSQEEFVGLKKKHTIIHHLKQDDMLLVRCLADEQPVPEASEVQPNLEDAYLQLLKSNN